MNTASGVVMAGAWIALYAGHQFGDHVVQTDRQANTKGAPTLEELQEGVSPWRGWKACAAHVASYTATQGLALLLVATLVPLTWAGAVAALVWSAGTHAIIDRRWIVRWWLTRTGREGWAEGPYLTDQSTHHAMLFLAAVMAATSTTVIETVLLTLLIAVLLAVCVGAEIDLPAPVAQPTRRAVPMTAGSRL